MEIYLCACAVQCVIDVYINVDTPRHGMERALLAQDKIGENGSEKVVSNAVFSICA